MIQFAEKGGEPDRARADREKRDPQRGHVQAAGERVSLGKCVGDAFVYHHGRKYPDRKVQGADDPGGSGGGAEDVRTVLT